MTFKRQLWLTLGLTATGMATSILVACGGGSGGSSSSSSLASSSGTISAFGSVFVNGKEFFTGSNTSVTDGDGDQTNASASDLQVGMNADVSASGNSANSIVFTSAVRGEIDSIDATNSIITVLGQPVLVTAATTFSGTVGTTALATANNPLSALSTGTYVVVHGFIECSGTATTTPCPTQVVANLVIAPATTGSYKASGYVSGIPTTSTPATAPTSFTLNGLTVNLGSNTSCSTSAGVAPTVAACTGLVNGQYVVARAATAPVVTTGSTPSITLTADTIKVSAQSPALTAGSTAALEGPVSQINTTNNSFVLRGVTINATGFANAVASLTPHQIVQVSGTVNADGSLTATAMQVEQHANMTINAPLDSASTTTVTVLGEAFAVNNATRFEDRTATVQGQAFNINNFSTALASGNQVVVSGYVSVTNGQLVATKVTRIATSPTGTVKLKGEVTADSSTADTITVGGTFTATIGASTVLQAPGNRQAAGSPATFLGALTVAAGTTPGSTVEIDAAWSTPSTAGSGSAPAPGAIDATASTATATVYPASNGWGWGWSH